MMVCWVFRKKKLERRPPHLVIQRDQKSDVDMIMMKVGQSLFYTRGLVKRHRSYGVWRSPPKPWSALGAKYNSDSRVHPKSSQSSTLRLRWYHWWNTVYEPKPVSFYTASEMASDAVFKKQPQHLTIVSRYVQADASSRNCLGSAAAAWCRHHCNVTQSIQREMCEFCFLVEC